jgi:hypothetical protein
MIKWLILTEVVISIVAGAVGAYVGLEIYEKIEAYYDR